MLKRLSSRELLTQLAQTWEYTLREAWLAAIAEIRNAATLKALVERLERGDVQGAVGLLNIDADRFARFELAIVEAYNAGGASIVGSMPRLADPGGNRIQFSWGVRNLPAEQTMRQHAATLVDDLVDEQLAVARSVLVDGLSRGQNPRQTALGLVGRINRRTGLREGGVLGLTASQAATLDRIYLGLRSGDAGAMRAYLDYALRDKRFDGHVLRALAEGSSLPADAVDRIVKAYSNRALKYRADNLALTETNIALAKAKTDAFQQQIDAGKLDVQDLTKTWGRSVSLEKRVDHLAMIGVTVPFDQPFVLPDGTQCTGPHDPSLPARHLISCKCSMEMQVDFTAQALRRYRERTGNQPIQPDLDREARRAIEGV